MTNPVTTTETGNTTKREIHVEVASDVVARETEVVVQKLQKFARIPGFRTGKVPASVIRKRFPEEIRSEVVEHLVPRFFRQEADRQGLVPVSQPQVTELHLHEGEALRFKANFEVLPPIEVSGYDSLRIDKPDTSVSDQELENAITELRERGATYVVVEDRPLQDGDFAQVSLKGIPLHGQDSTPEAAAPATEAAKTEDAVKSEDGVKHEDSAKSEEAAKPVEVDDVLVEVGGTTTVKDFTDNLRGASPGEERVFEVQYPADFSDQRIAGKRFSYTVQVKGIKRKELPELTEEFAKELGVANVEEIHTRMRENIEQRKRIEAEREGKEKIVDELLKGHDFEVPESLLERQIDVRLERGLRALAAQGMRTEDMKRMDFPRLRAGQREAAVREVKTSLLLDRIADKESVEVRDDEIEKEVQAIAEQSRQGVDAVRSRLAGEGALERMRGRMRNEKTLDMLYARASQQV